MKYIIANWKANKNIDECENWLNKFLKEIESVELQNTVIICPPHPLIYFTKEFIKNKAKNIYVGSQDISCFEKGKYTGEVTSPTLSGLIKYTIIGHSERREYFKENEEVLSKKINLAQKYSIEPIYCIRSSKDIIPQNINFVTYEPVSAIGTGDNENLEKVLAIKKELNLSPSMKFLYGGSVNENNANEYLNSSEINGLLIGSASLDPERFAKIVKNV